MLSWCSVRGKVWTGAVGAVSAQFRPSLARETILSGSDKRSRHDVVLATVCCRVVKFSTVISVMTEVKSPDHLSTASPMTASNKL
jgi:hypothetical protein